MDSKRVVPKARSFDREDQILQLAAGRSVLHVGLGGFVSDAAVTAGYVAQDLRSTLHGRLSGVAATLTGADINPVVLSAFSEQVPGAYVRCDINAPERIRLLTSGSKLWSYRMSSST